jgi:hypothetical protein
MSICNSIHLLFQPDVILFSFLLLFSSLVILLGFGSKLTEYYFPTFAKRRGRYPQGTPEWAGVESGGV